MTLSKLQLIINITRSQNSYFKIYNKPFPERIQLLKEVRGLGFEYLSGIAIAF
jgi:hypothetical protein